MASEVCHSAGLELAKNAGRIRCGADHRVHIGGNNPDDIFFFLKDTSQRTETCFVISSSRRLWHECDEHLILGGLIVLGTLDLAARIPECLDRRCVRRNYLTKGIFSGRIGVNTCGMEGPHPIHQTRGKA
jgi:hypothetical protein